MQKYKLSLLTASLAASLNVVASPFYTFGEDDAALYLTLNSSVQNRSNVTLDADDEEQDIRWSFTPGFILDFGPGETLADLTFTAQNEIRRFSDNDQFDTELLRLNLAGSYEGAKYQTSGNLFYRESAQNTDDVNPDNALVETERYGFNTSFEFTLSSKFSASTGFNFAHTEYKTPSISDRDVFKLPINVFYKYSDKLDLSTGYTYQKEEVDLSTDREGHFFNVGTRGQLAPKLLGNTQFGIKYFEDGNFDQTFLAWNGDLTYLHSIKSRFVSTLSRDISASGNGSSLERTNFGIRGIYDYSPSVSYSAFANYSLVDYKTSGLFVGNAGREDKILSIGANVNYRLTEYITVSGGYTFLNNDSDAPALADSDVNGYTDHTINLSASFKY